MKSQIIYKLNKLISKGVRTEIEVYYLIGQTRKYLESEYQKKVDREREYFTLSLVEDWILHPKLDGGGAQRKLDEYEKYLNEQSRDPFKFMKEGLTLFTDLYNDLHKFCSLYNVNTKFLNKQSWHKFVKLLIEILKDLPLSGKNDRYIKQFVIEDTGEDNLVTFLVHGRDGVSGRYAIDLKIISELHPAYK